MQSSTLQCVQSLVSTPSANVFLSRSQTIIQSQAAYIKINQLIMMIVWYTVWKFVSPAR